MKIIIIVDKDDPPGEFRTFVRCLKGIPVKPSIYIGSNKLFDDIPKGFEDKKKEEGGEDQ